MKILVTGFDPFGGEKVNPSFEAVKLLPDTIEGSEIIKLEIPTVQTKSMNTIIEAIKQHNPDVVLCVGQAGGRTAISMEKVGINLDDFRIKDNEGNQPVNQKIDEQGPDAYFTTLPINAMTKNVLSNTIPATVSYTAGTFVCNHVLYGTLHYIAQNKLDIKAGFIHIPFMYEQLMDKKNVSGMPLQTISDALYYALEVIAKGDTEIDLQSGDTC